jgi:polyhydroxybutyrate depolymerase
MNKGIFIFGLVLFFIIPTWAQTNLTGTLQHNGVSRNYRLHLPPGFDKNIPIPLVFNLHGFTSNAVQQEIYSGMNAVSDKEGFAVCYPNGVGAAWNVGWNFGSTANDVGFISALIDDLHTKYGFNLKKIYSCGMSNGGFMSYRLACELNNKVAAIASVTGSMVRQALDKCDPKRPVPVLEIHGTADAVVAYGGTPGISESIDKVLTFWRVNNGCFDDKVIEMIPNIAADNTTTEKWTYKNCSNGQDVVHFKVTNGAHTWPGSAINNGVTSQDFKASEEIWKFFSQFELPTISGVEEKPWTVATIYPNPVDDFINIWNSSHDQIIITDINGRIVYQNNEAQDQVMVMTENLTPGVYTIQLVNAQKMQSHKFVKI